MDICNQSGVCCKLFLINLNKEEYLSENYETEFANFGITSFEEAEAHGRNILARREDGICAYLKDNKCSIHSTRPQVCRGFFCNSEKVEYKDMVRQVKEVK